MNIEKARRQRQKGKLLATERLALLLDEHSYVEIAPNEGKDGVYTGYGTVNGEKVFVFAQDFTEKGGSIGLLHGERIARLIDLALQERRPVVGIFDSGGARIEEGIRALAGCGAFLYQNTRASGVIPQISVVLGPCAGAASYSQSISDFVFSVENVGCTFITGPDVVKSVTGEESTAEELGSAKMHAEETGVVHVLKKTEKECFCSVRSLLDLLTKEKIDLIPPTSAGFLKKVEELSQKTAYDVRDVISEIADKDSFFELQSSYAPNLAIGLGRLAGKTVGFVANDPHSLGGAIDCKASGKGGRFVRFCDCFSIPVITFVDTPGYLPGKEQEKRGILRDGAKLLYAYAEATTPKITVILRKAYGGAYIAMGSKHLGADKVYALSSCQAAVMGAEGAVSILNKKRTALMTNAAKERYLAEKAKEYATEHMNYRELTENGYADRLLSCDEVRDVLCHDVLAFPKPTFSKKHGNIPL